VTHVRRDVDTGGRGLQLAKKIPERQGRTTVLADDDRGDALADYLRRIAPLEEAPIVMAMGIDEARREHQALSVDDGFFRERLQIADRRDFRAADAHRDTLRWCAGTVDDSRIGDQRGVLREARCGREHHQHGAGDETAGFICDVHIASITAATVVRPTARPG
jgi:hypothetical protein